MKNDRTSFKKGTPENAMLKLALNGAYGKSLSEHSVLYDPKFGLTVTINGQLLMYLLCEKLLETAGLKLLQVNTDGLTIRYPLSTSQSSMIYSSLLSNDCFVTEI
jgi:DNA polymerase elongation subunit (family B)